MILSAAFKYGSQLQNQIYYVKIFMKVIAMQIVRHIIMHEYYFAASFSRIIYVIYLSCLFLHNSLIISTIFFSITIELHYHFYYFFLHNNWTALSEVWYLKIRINMLEDPAYFKKLLNLISFVFKALYRFLSCSSIISLKGFILNNNVLETLVKMYTLLPVECLLSNPLFIMNSF